MLNNDALIWQVDTWPSILWKLGFDSSPSIILGETSSALQVFLDEVKPVWVDSQRNHDGLGVDIEWTHVNRFGVNKRYRSVKRLLTIMETRRERERWATGVRLYFKSFFPSLSHFICVEDIVWRELSHHFSDKFQNHFLFDCVHQVRKITTFSIWSTVE